MEVDLELSGEELQNMLPWIQLYAENFPYLS